MSRCVIAENSRSVRRFRAKNMSNIRCILPHQNPEELHYKTIYLFRVVLNASSFHWKTTYN